MIAEWLESRLSAGEFCIGEIRVSTGLSLRHVDDRHPTEVFNKPEDAREIARYDDEGNYRPLRTAPNLRHGWQLDLKSTAEVRLALDFLYPAALGTWIACERGTLAAVNLRETLNRQTGMYRVTQLITDGQAEDVIRRRCNRESGCLRRQLWRISAETPSPFTETTVETRGSQIPILCAEACNLVVADCRPVAKQNLPKSD